MIAFGFQCIMLGTILYYESYKTPAKISVDTSPGTGAAAGIGAGTIPAIAEGIVGFLLLIVSIVITIFLFRYTKEKKTLANIITVLAGIFAILAAFYFLWMIK
jgi:hypothetical protein